MLRKYTYVKIKLQQEKIIVILLSVYLLRVTMQPKCNKHKHKNQTKINSVALLQFIYVPKVSGKI